MAARAPQHRDAQRRVGLEGRKASAQAPRHRAVDRIALARPVHHDREDRTVDVLLDKIASMAYP